MNGWIGQGLRRRLAGLLLALLPLAGMAATPDFDVRVLVDISGSMKQNDPQNLRRPALRLLADLLPPEAQAGVWTFGKFVNLQVPLAMVDDDWRKQAAAGIEKVHSRGAFTNIELAIDKALVGWDQPAADTRRSLILLTDGVVDVSKDPLDSLASRERILDAQLELLRSSGAAVHTVALSDRADHALLKKLSQDTDGWYERAEDAAQLQRIFLRLFEKAAPAETLPLEGNRFRVDGSIDEMTLLVFTPPGAPALQIQPPQGEAFGAMDAPQNTHWRGGDGYALITVKNPAIGEWLIIGEVDPDNRVMVVTDLKLAVQPLPNGVSPGQRLSVQAELLKEGERITQQGFLELVEMRLAQTLPDGEQRQKLVVDDGSGVDLAGFDGLFSAALANTEAEGQHELLLTVDGGSFQRSFRHRFAVQWPADLRVEALGGAPPNYAISLSPRSDVIAAEGLQLEAELLAPGGEILPLALAEELGEWRGETGELSLVGDYRLRLRLRGQQPNGEPVSLRLPERMLAGRALPSPAADVAAEPELVVEEPGATNWGLIGGAVLGVNLLLGGLGWLYWRRSRRQVDSLIEDDDADAAVDTAVEFDAADAARDDPAEMAAALDAESPVDTVEEAEVPVRTEDEFDARGALDEVPGEVLAQAGMEEVDTLAEQPDDEPEPELIVADDEAEEPPLSAEEPDEVMDAIGASEPADDDDAAPAMLLDDVEVDWPEGIEVDGLDDALSDAESEAAAATTASEDDAVAAARSAEDLLTDLDDAALFDETDDADEDPRQQAQGGS